MTPAWEHQAFVVTEIWKKIKYIKYIVQSADFALNLSENWRLQWQMSSQKQQFNSKYHDEYYLWDSIKNSALHVGDLAIHSPPTVVGSMVLACCGTFYPLEPIHL
jgi:hypothetical protein